MLRPQSEFKQAPKLQPWQLSLNRFFNRASIELLIGALVILSVCLTLVEFWLESELAFGGGPVATAWGTLTTTHLQWLTQINDYITYIFIVELSLRFVAASPKSAFFAEFWLDILAVIPLFRIFRSARAVRLLRVVRLFRLLGVWARLSSHYPKILRNSAVDFMIVTGLLLMAVVFGTIAITHFENRGSFNDLGRTNLAGQVGPVGNNQLSGKPDFGTGAGDLTSNSPTTVRKKDFDLESSFWYSIYTLLAAEPVPYPPKTVSSRIVTVFLMLAGMAIFAIFAGTVSAFMVDRMRTEGRVVEWDALSNHIVICGWTQKTKIIIEEYRASRTSRRVPIVVITELNSELIDQEISAMASVMFVHDDFTRVSALRRAGIDRATTCLVLTDTSGGRSEQDADARTILAALTVEKMNPDVFTCAELVNRNYASHLKVGNVNDYVVTSEYGAHVLAQTAMKRGLSNMVSELLTYEQGNEFHRVPVPESWVGASFDEKLSELRREHASILVAVHSPDQPPNINPTDYHFVTGDEVVLIAVATPNLT
ncbi:ion transporter [Mariniblastus sp.]|nr:ion transporter [Mariniblastus sp.]